MLAPLLRRNLLVSASYAINTGSDNPPKVIAELSTEAESLLPEEKDNNLAVVAKVFVSKYACEDESPNTSNPPITRTVPPLPASFLGSRVILESPLSALFVILLV